VFRVATSALTFVGSSNAATICGGSATNNIVGGTGGVLFGSEGSDHDHPATAPGGATIFGTAGHDVTYLGDGDMLYAPPALAMRTLSAAGFRPGTNDLFAVGFR